MKTDELILLIFPVFLHIYFFNLGKSKNDARFEHQLLSI